MRTLLRPGGLDLFGDAGGRGGPAADDVKRIVGLYRWEPERALARGRDAYAAAVPLRHMGSPEDVAEAVAFLASEGGRFITGQKLSVNGGNTLA